MGLGDIVQDAGGPVKSGKKKEQTTPPDRKSVDEVEHDKDELLKKIRDAAFLRQFCEDIGEVVVAPGPEEWTTSGDEDVEEPLPEGYVDCTDRVEYILSQTKYLSCPHCDDGTNKLRQRRGSGARRGETWARCGGCSRILVDLQAGNRDKNGEIEHQTGLDGWL